MTRTPLPIVLVIEDEANIAAVIKRSLVGVAVDVHLALDGETGVELARELQPDLILLDLALPGMSGWEALAAIRSTPFGANVPVVIVTADGDSATATEARDAGADDFLTKPFLPSQLRRTVEEITSFRFPETA